MILLITGFAKILSAFGQAKILSLPDPILWISSRNLMLLAGILEVSISSLCLFLNRRKLSLGLVMWMAANCMTYRFGLWWIRWERPCSCLGNLTDAIGISPQTADWIMKCVLAYLLIGALVALLLLKRAMTCQVTIAK